MSGFPPSGFPTRGESWRWGILIPSVIRITHPNYYVFLYIVCAWYGPWVSVGDTTQWFQYFQEQITSRKGQSLVDLFDNADQWQQEKKSIIQSGQSGSVGRARQGIRHQGDGRLTSEFVSLDLSTRYYKIFQDFSINCEDICWETHANWGGWIRIDRVNTPTLLIGTIGT